MFSRFQFRNCNADPAQVVERKRPIENDNFHHDEIEKSPEKMGRFELDDSDDESSVCLPPDLENFVRKCMRKHVGDKAIKERVLMDNPLPVNVDKPPAVNIYIKELVKETVSGNRTLRVHGSLTNIQETIRNMLAPVAQLRISAVKQRDELLTMEVAEDKAAWKANFDKMDAISKSLDSVVSLVGQASQRTSYYRRHLISESLMSDYKEVKTVLND